jgi:UDP-N-acetylglucosamine:LPS N-acetylglucosamine transferase
MAARALILSTDIGAGHDLPAELLAAALRERGVHAVVADGLRAMGRVPRALGRDGMETILRRAPLIFDAEYWLVQTFAPTRKLATRLLREVGGPPLLRLIERLRPDVVVSTYPGTTEVLGELRRSGRLTVPCVAAITDLAGLRYWAHPGVDQHLIVHVESRADVFAIIGDGRDVRPVRGFSHQAFEQPPSRAAARAALGLNGGSVVVISGGGWGVGDVEGAAQVALQAGAHAVALCGTNERLRLRLACAGVRALPFTDRMCEWLAAADVLVHSTAGLTVFEAQTCGTRVISYGWGVGHIRANNAAYRRHGIAAVAPGPKSLREEIERALAAGPPEPLEIAGRQPAADAVLELVSAR